MFLFEVVFIQSTFFNSAVANLCVYAWNMHWSVCRLEPESPSMFCIVFEFFEIIFVSERSKTIMVHTAKQLIHFPETKRNKFLSTACNAKNNWILVSHYKNRIHVIHVVSHWFIFLQNNIFVFVQRWLKNYKYLRTFLWVLL